MYKTVYLDNTYVKLKDGFHNSHSWCVYPNDWRVKSITIGSNESASGKLFIYGKTDRQLYNANVLKTNPLRFQLGQPTQRYNDKILAETDIIVYPDELEITDEFKNKCKDVYTMDIFGLNKCDTNCIYDYLNGNNDFFTEIADKEIENAKKSFKNDTGFNYDSFKDIYDYHKTIKSDVEKFIEKINPYVEKELGLKLYIKYDPLCTVGFGERVTSNGSGYGRDGRISMFLEDFWRIIYWNRTHPDKMKGICYRKSEYNIHSEYGELDISEFFYDRQQ